MYATAFNSSDSPVTIDREGRTIDGRSWGTVVTTADEVEALKAAGTLYVYPELEPGPGQADAGNAAIEQTAAIRTRAEALEALEKEELVALGDAAGMPTSDVHKPELVQGLAFRLDFDAEKALEEYRAAQAKTKTTRKARTEKPAPEPAPEKPNEEG